MADVGIGINRVIQDVDGEAATVTNNKLDVNATLVAGATIDIGDVDMFLDGGTAIVGGSGTISAGTLRVTMATDDTVATDLTRIKTAVELIDDAIYTDDANWGDGLSKHMLVGGLYQSSMQSVTDGDVAPFQVDANGVLKIVGTVDLGSTDNTVLDNILTKNTEIDAVLDTIKVDTEAIETAVELLDNAISGNEMQVDVVASLPTGSNNIGIVGLSAGSNTFGKLAANSGVDIGDVDVTSTVQSDPFGTFVSYPDFEAATTATAINDATNGVNASITDAKEIIIQTDDENTGYIMVGSSGNALAGSVGSRKGIKMNGGETLILAHSTFANIFIDASGSSQYVNVAYFK